MTADENPFNFRITGMVTSAIVPSTSMAGDYNGDGSVDAVDYVVWRKTLNQSVAAPYVGADGNGDGTVDQDDLAVWKTHFGETSSPGAAPGRGMHRSRLSRRTRRRR